MKIKLPTFFFRDVNDRPKLVAAFIFIIALVAFIWQLASSFYEPAQLNKPIQPATIVNKPAQIEAQSLLFNSALFGTYLPNNLSDADIKQSMLDVEVVGIMYSSKENESQVILKAGGGEEQYYLVGDKLPGGAVIKRITEKTVVVLHNGALEKLSLPKNELIFIAPAKPLIKE